MTTSKKILLHLYHTKLTMIGIWSGMLFNIKNVVNDHETLSEVGNGSVMLFNVKSEKML